ncbi:Leucine efflux protein [compost metagenome]|uniref:LysE family translocator n=1 Tax=Pseudomonas TaxID=286 RepID=UPI0004908827|nr:MULTISPECIES: LysE family translocator [Pseudomonas]MCW2271035.1 threonine/homoserine/homoserine lactone efflux protein [Pseudomonas sp. JUb96]PRA58807.1 LysE family translocator [Pseudomonas sp. MYb187]
MNITLLLSYALTVLLLIATPGPVVALVVDTAARAGRRQAVATALGTNGASLVLIAVAAAVILTSVVVDPRWLAALSLVGCLFIAYLAMGSLRQGRQDDAARPATRGARGGWWQGFAVGLSNPKDILFFVAFFPQFIQVSTHAGHSLLLLSLVWVVIDVAILGLYIFMTQRLIASRHHHLIRLTSGGLLLVIAVAGLFYNLDALRS